MSIIVTEAMKEWADTPTQLKYVEAILAANGNVRKASRVLGVHHKTLQTVVKRLTERAAIRGYSPAHDMTHPVPAGFAIRGTSTLYDEVGEIKQQWVKTKADDIAREAIIREAFEAMAQELPRVEPRLTTYVASDAGEQLANLFTITDYHMGMLAWHQETGADWDLAIAEDMLYKMFEQMLMGAPDARVAIINQLGDFLHTDGFKALTPEHGNLLDADGRFPKIVTAAVRVLRRIVDMALETHDEVHVILAEGNHDMVSSIWLRIMFAALYENEPRVTVDTSSYPYYIYEHGETLLGFHHGHLSRNASLPALFAAHFRKEWGRTTKAYIHTGHRHHQHTQEFPGALVIQHATLAAPDAYAARGGWMSERQAKRITYHTSFGEVGSEVVTPEMLAPLE